MAKAYLIFGTIAITIGVMCFILDGKVNNDKTERIIARCKSALVIGIGIVLLLMSFLM